MTHELEFTLPLVASHIPLPRSLPPLVGKGA
jgi:hypothetical protein